MVSSLGFSSRASGASSKVRNAADSVRRRNGIGLGFRFVRGIGEQRGEHLHGVGPAEQHGTHELGVALHEQLKGRGSGGLGLTV